MSLQVATGGNTSCTVTVALQVDELPFISVTVRTTGLGLEAMCEQFKVEGATAKEAMPQASLLPLSMSDGRRRAMPITGSSISVIFWQRATGGVLSKTVTVAVQSAELPATSVPVRVTVFMPVSAQVKVLGETVSEAMPQSSKEPLSTCAAVMDELPLASRVLVMS